MKFRYIFGAFFLIISFYLLLPKQGISQIENVVVKDQFLKEVEDLINNSKIQQAFKIILRDDQKTFHDLITLTEIPAPPFKEKERALFFLDLLEEAGVDSSWIDKVGNVIALRKGSKRNKIVALDAHTDTVFPEGTDVSTTISKDTIFAPGVGDDTRGMVMLLAILRALNEANIQTESDLVFVGSVGGGHSWGSFGLANPHHAMASAINTIVEAADKYTSAGPKTTYNVGRMGGGTSVNSIPFSSWMEVDIRSLLPSRLDVMEEILRAAVQAGLEEQNKIRRDGRPLIVDIEMIGKRPSGELSPEIPLIQRALAACNKFNVKVDHARGSTNSNIPISLGIPAVTIGRGGKGGWGHSLLEWWANEDGHIAIQYALLLLVSESGLVNESKK
jgi:acetylornithine deacetylase/succinyl-diaminopimelate desuccinylase-like protein